MPSIVKAKTKDIIIARLDYGKDILNEVHKICEENNIKLGQIEGIGAVSKACVGFYDQEAKKYESFEINEELEITSLKGNISLKDNKPFAHLHINLSDEKGRVYGGHLFSDTIVFACEVIITVFEGKDLNRAVDPETKLFLWDM